MTTIESVESPMTEEQMSRIQKWVLSHDKTVKYVAFVLTLMFVLDILATLGLGR